MTKTPTPQATAKAELLPCPFCGTQAKERSTWMCCTNPKCHLFNSACRNPDEWNTRSPLPAPAKQTEGDSGRAVFAGDMRLMVDPSVPADMILFPDEETRKWYTANRDRLIDCLKSIRKHLQKMQDEKVKYDFNADPLYTTLIEDWIHLALDKQEFCPDWMCQSECPANMALKEHLEQAALTTPPALETVTAAELITYLSFTATDSNGSHPVSALQVAYVVEKLMHKYPHNIKIVKE